jgi:hypothetical protein
MYLTLHDGRAWKTFDWDATDRLYEKGLIENPRNPEPSPVVFDRRGPA